MITALPKLTLVLGGARSGKSRYAEHLVASAPPPWTYIATGEALDEEMAERIGEHRQRRGNLWLTVEAPLALADAINREGQSGQPLIIDCLTLWLSNVMLKGRAVEPEADMLLAALAGARSPIVAVSNEVGLGIVPESKLGREFRDAQGRLNQQVAGLAELVVFVAAGLPLILKQPS